MLVLAFLAGSVDAVIAARAVTGVGAALITPLSLTAFPCLWRRFPGGGRPLGPCWWGPVLLVDIPMAALGIGVCLPLLRRPYPTLGFGFAVVPATVGALGRRAGAGASAMAAPAADAGQ
ncbi:hypothetical protein [Streptomyces sp. CL12]|uniref:hypothetical protein n=1 Tax=Streptomyces sp. CL12 TaxID=3391744 RepID=UPI003A80A55A